MLISLSCGSQSEAVPACSDSTERLPKQQSTRILDATDLLQLQHVGGQVGQGLSVSPDGNSLAFELHRADLAGNTYRATWMVASTDGGSNARKIADAGDPGLFEFVDDLGYHSGAWIGDAPVWSSDSEWIYYRRRDDNETQIWRSNRRGDRSERLTQNPADVVRLSLSSSGSKLLFLTDAPRAALVTERFQQSEHGIRLDPDVRWSTLRTRPISAPYALTGGKPVLWVYELTTRTERPATVTEIAQYEEEEKMHASKVQTLGSDVRFAVSDDKGSRVAWLTLADPQLDGIDPPLQLFASRDPGGRKPIRCGAPECVGRFSLVSSTPVWWSNDGRIVYFVRMEGPNFGRRHWYQWDLTNNSVRRVLSTTGDWVSNCTPVAFRAICFRETPSHPRTIVSIDLKRGSIDTIYDPNPHFQSFALGAVERLEWSDRRGNSTHGFLVRPVNYQQGVRYPLIVVGYRAKSVVHGGTGDEYPAHLFAGNGFAVLVYDTPDAWDVLARADTAEDFMLATWGADLFDVSGPQSLVEAAVDLLDHRGIIDVDRIGITGFSTGASWVSYALVNSGRFAAAAVSHPLGDPFGYYVYGEDASGRENMRRMGLGPLGGGKDSSWIRISPRLNVERLRAPVLMNLSDEEFLPAMPTAIAFHEVGRPLEVFVYPDEHHVKWQPQHRLRIYERNVDWFNFWLRSCEDLGPHKTTQYEKWRELRTRWKGTSKDRVSQE